VFVLYPGTFEILVNVGREIPVSSLTSFKFVGVFAVVRRLIFSGDLKTIKNALLRP